MNAFYHHTIMALAVLFLAGCGGEPEVRTYVLVYPEGHGTEKVHEHAPTSDGLPDNHPPADAPDRTAYRWTVPEAWAEQAASGMRIATFVIKGDDPEMRAECSIIRLTGDSPVLANVNRWRGQLELPDVDMDAVKATSEEVKTRAGTMALVIDVGGANTASAQNFLAAIVQDGDGTIFIKLFGPRATVAAESKAFMELVLSFGRAKEG